MELLVWLVLKAHLIGGCVRSCRGNTYLLPLLVRLRGKDAMLIVHALRLVSLHLRLRIRSLKPRIILRVLLLLLHVIYLMLLLQISLSLRMMTNLLSLRLGK